MMLMHLTRRICEDESVRVNLISAETLYRAQLLRVHKSFHKGVCWVFSSDNGGSYDEIIEDSGEMLDVHFWKHKILVFHGQY